MTFTVSLSALSVVTEVSLLASGICAGADAGVTPVSAFSVVLGGGFMVLVDVVCALRNRFSNLSSRYGT